MEKLNINFMNEEKFDEFENVDESNLYMVKASSKIIGVDVDEAVNNKIQIVMELPESPEEGVIYFVIE